MTPREAWVQSNAFDVLGVEPGLGGALAASFKRSAMNVPHVLSEEDIFRHAVSVESDVEREAYIEQVCGSNQQLLRRVRALLEVESQSEKFLERCAEGVKVSAALEQLAAPICEDIESLGPYRVVEKIGEGGMGLVYLVRQTGELQRFAALKILRHESLTPELVARFEGERMILAKMDHPNIAQVFDSGTTDRGRPYFVMEWLRGMPITQYCDDKQLNLAERIELFIQVCQGVQHAHYKGIIHRDLKPSNILVAEFDHVPVPKIIDFGIAKVSASTATSKDTRRSVPSLSLLGTLSHMSPEQFVTTQEALDTRSDVYSLGVVLYELLCGTRPVLDELANASSFEEFVDIVAKMPPRKPSQEVAISEAAVELATARGTKPTALKRELRRDLDGITLKALAKDPVERYQSLFQLAHDLQLCLERRPVLTMDPTLVVKMQRFCQRNRGAVVLGALLGCFFALVLYLGVANWQQSFQRQQLGSRLTLTKTELADLRLHDAQESHARHVVYPQVKQLREQGFSVKAFREARQVQEWLKDDLVFQEEWANLTATVSCTHLPVGTRVLARDALATNDRWLYLGQVPFVHLQVPKGYVRLRLEHDDYVAREMQMKFPSGLRKLHVSHLALVSESEPGMVRVTRTNDDGNAQTQSPIRHDFWIDQFEVTNAQYQEFVERGGYTNPEYWSHLTFVLDGEELTWEQARSQFVDQTGMWGPAAWRQGRCEPGREKHPVAGVSWYEANAYAKFRGKCLPTVAHWRRAAFCDQPGVMSTLSNFLSQGTTVGGTFQGIGKFDAYDMYGNVKEWCWNSDQAGNRPLLGGAFDDPNYHYFFPRLVSPWERQVSNGFRCVKYCEGGEPDEATLANVSGRDRKMTPDERLPLADISPWYVYARELPLNPTTIDKDSADGFNDAFRHEVVEVDGPGGRERLRLHLLIPRETTKPLESLIIIPGVGRYNASGTFELGGRLEFQYAREFARKGRLVCFPVYFGTFERWPGVTLGKTFSESPANARNDWLYVGQEISRTVDYLLTREDVHPSRVMTFGISNGAIRSIMALATDQRIAAGILLSGGYSRWHIHRPEICEYHFSPHVQQPVLMVNGLDDSIFPYETSQIPLFEDLGTKDKRHFVFPAHHLPQHEDVMTVVEEWLEQKWPTPQ